MVSGLDSQRPGKVGVDGDTPYWVAFRNVYGIGPIRFQHILRKFGTMQAAWHASSHQLGAVLDRRSLSQLLEDRRSVDPLAEFEGLKADGIRVLTLLDEDYPDLLREIPAPPPVLFLKGDIRLSDRRAVAIVGTRQATPYGRDMALTIATDLARAGVTVVSGMALGIDGVAHQASLDAGGRTLAVLGSGVRTVYPYAHRELAGRIVENGAMLSDFHPDTKPDGPNFPARNRLISGLSLGVVVIEAPMRSGALITVEFAAEQGREVFAVPGSALSAACAGSNRILRDGARLVRSADDILEDLRLGEAPRQMPLGIPSSLDEASRRVLAALSAEPRHIDEISATVDMPIASLASTLMTLELQNFVRNVGAQYYARVG